MVSKVASQKKKALVRLSQCAHIKDTGEQCRAKPLRGQPTCRKHTRHRPTDLGIYSTAIDASLRTIASEVESIGKLSELRKTDLEDEIALARLQVMDLMKMEGVPALVRLKALSLVSKIIKDAHKVKEIDAAALNTNFLNSILEAVAYSFHRANAIADPAQRSQIFIRELSLWFPQVTGEREDDGDDDIEGELVED